MPPSEMPAAAPETVDYRLSPVFADDKLTALAVEIRLRGDPSGVTRLKLPDRWADARELQRYVRDLEVDGARAVVSESPTLRRMIQQLALVPDLDPDRRAACVRKLAGQ